MREEADGKKEAEEGSGEEVRKKLLNSDLSQLFLYLVLLREY